MSEKLNPISDSDLTILQEECSELIHIISKIKRFGINFSNPVSGVHNYAQLIQEVADVLVLIDSLRLPEKHIAVGKIVKIKKLAKFRDKGEENKKMYLPVFEQSPTEEEEA